VGMLMNPAVWEVLSWVATALGFPLTLLAILLLLRQMRMEATSRRLAALDALYSELDTHEARLARQFIYDSPNDQLRWDYLHSPGHEEARKRVEDTIASLERVAYRIITNQIPSEDAFQLYGGVMLSVANKVWVYIEDQRRERARSTVTHHLVYRRFFESVVRNWARRYARQMGKSRPSKRAGTQAMLQEVFSSQGHGQMGNPPSPN